MTISPTPCLRRLLALLAICVSGCAWLERAPGNTPVYPTRLLFSGGDRAGGTVSPDGRLLAFLAPHGRGWSIWVAPVDQPEDRRAVVIDAEAGVAGFGFSANGSHLLYAVDATGAENRQLFAVDLATRRTVALSHRGAAASVANQSDARPGEVLLQMNERNYRQFDLVRVRLSDGSRQPLFNNTGYSDVITDAQFRLRYATEQTDAGGARWYERKDDAWKLWSEVPQADAMTTRMLGLTQDGGTLYTLDSRGRNTAALYAVDTRTGARRLLHADDQADVDRVILHPATGVVQAASSQYLRRRWVALDPAMAADLSRLEALAAGGDFHVATRSRDDRTWVVHTERPDASRKVYLYDRSRGALKLWYDTQPDVTRIGVELLPMHTAEIAARDGLVLPSYLTLPPGSDQDANARPERPQPMVLLVHGGPWARDEYGLNLMHQWLANRGYAVLSVNFRGSTGFGKAFVNAGDLEWGRKMHDDLLDAVEWAVQNGIARRDKVAIMGGSYGGYAALAGLALTPDTFACGISIVGPSNLITMIEAVPGYWDQWLRTYSSRVGDVDTVAGRKLLAERSPLTHAQRIERPLLLAHGSHDPRVKQAESDQMFEALRHRGVPVVYAVFADEGHGIAGADNRLVFHGIAEQFLRSCLTGSARAGPGVYRRFGNIGDSYMILRVGDWR